ncbi:MAG: CehA/McbA family metallohydrolase [Deltaproteobacteria bacterium]|nr:CehA/McbA family metallohydrolase [Deltaproteobacteria bacterium]
MRCPAAAVSILLLCQAAPCTAGLRAGEARIGLRISDAGSGAPLGARLGFADQDAWNGFRPLSGFTGWAIRKRCGDGHAVFWYVGPESSFAIPAGPRRLQVLAGPERVPAELSIDPQPREVLALDVRLARWCRLEESGWVSADAHLHIARFHSGDDRVLFDLMDAEDLDVAMLADWAGRSKGRLRPGWGEWAWTAELLGARAARDGRLILPVQDWAPPGKACTLKLMGHRTPVRGLSRCSQAAIVEKVIAEGGLASGSLGRIHIAGALLGRVRASEILAIDGFRNLGDFYDLLGVGCRIAAIAGTDVQSSIASQTIVEYNAPPGSERFYVHLDDEPGDARSLIAAIAAGRTFVTTGPSLELEIDGVGPGGELRLERPKKVEVRLRLAWAAAPGGELRLCRNGEPVFARRLAAGHAGADGYAQRWRFELDLDRSSWLAARLDGERVLPGMERPVAHTSPVYVLVGGLPIFEPGCARRLLERIAGPAEIEQSGFASPGERAAAIRWARRARALLLERLDRGASVTDTP